MTYQEFRDKHYNEYIDVDNYPKEWKFQCFDLAQLYAREVINVPDYVFAGCGVVKNLIYDPVERSQMNEYFDEVSTIDMQPGDVCIWGNGDAGHIAIFDHYNPDDNNCYYFSQNPNPSQVIAINLPDHHCFRRKKEKKKEKVDQWLNPGSHVQIPGTFEVVDINVKDNTAKVRIDGKDYWISSTPLLEVE